MYFNVKSHRNFFNVYKIEHVLKAVEILSVLKMYSHKQLCVSAGLHALTEKLSLAKMATCETLKR